MLNLPQFGLARQAPVVQAIGAGLVHRAQRGEFLQVVASADVFVVVQQQLALGVQHRHHGAGQPPGAGRQRARLRQRGVAVAVFPAEAVARGDQVGRPGRRHKADA